MQQAGRLRLRPWLEEQIQSGRYPGVSWLDQSAGIFQIPWKHAARHGWSIDQDATLFRSWAIHTGRFRPGKDKPDPKTWKANFRCALNSLPDICELQEHSRKRGNNAYRVYRMLPSVHTHRRRRGLRLLSRPQEKQTGRGVERLDSCLPHTWQPCTHRPVSVAAHRAENPTGDTFTHIYQAPGTWEAKAEEPEQSEASFEQTNHWDDAELWNQTVEQRGWRRQTLWDPWQSTTLCAAEDNQYFLHADSDLFGPSWIKELSEWSTHQQTLMP
ncbi:uncharacterized protein LOC142904431 [Nelusetta ayraudi]|uniref:uncharacterized protein LOC142904431 n=1 Tax=Nelusetta ayraudi TaxID=303726 RepID=UPI003F6F645D